MYNYIYKYSYIEIKKSLNFIHIIFLYIYPIWAISEGWGTWNDQNKIRGLAHPSSSPSTNKHDTCIIEQGFTLSQIQPAGTILSNLQPPE